MAKISFGDHTLLAETIAEAYNIPEHIPGPGILTLLSGQGRFIVGGETHRIDRGRFLIIGEGRPLSIRLPNPGAQPLFLFFHSDLIGKALQRQKAELCWLERTHPMSPALNERLAWLQWLGNNCSSFSALKADAMIGDILRDLISDAVAAGAAAANLPVARKSTRIQLFHRLSLAREWIEANYALPISLKTIARQALLNNQHFLRMFRDCFGLTPHQYLTTVRLTAASKLLTATSQPIAAICRQTGFESPSSFSGLFRARYGSSPLAFRTAKQ